MQSRKKIKTIQEKRSTEIQTKLSCYVKNPLIEKNTEKLPLKHPCSSLSPPNEKLAKKINMSEENASQQVQHNDNHIPSVLQEIIKEDCEMKESVHKDYSDLHTDYDKLKIMITTQQEVISKLEETITTNQHDMTDKLMGKIDHNSSKLAEVAEENKYLRKENIALKDRLIKIELNQLRNNVIITGMQEQPWENYETTKERVYDTIAAAMGRDASTALETARKVKISCCNRVGRYQVNKPRPICVTFEHREDKINLLQNKRNLPSGVFVNEEYPSHMMKNRDVLRPILKLAKGIPDYRERTKLQGDTYNKRNSILSTGLTEAPCRIGCIQSCTKGGREHYSLPWRTISLLKFPSITFCNRRTKISNSQALDTI